MIDTHCHILPGVDDGPATFQQALQMAKLALADGITAIVATPHVIDKNLSRSSLNASVSRFNERLSELGIPLEIVSGGEFSLLLDPMWVKNYCINNGKYVLVEFPHTHLPKTALEQLYVINMQGLVPIIAHPERNPSILRNPDLLLELMEANVMVQVTAGSLCGNFGRNEQQCARYLIKNDMVHILASDAHDHKYRKPILSKGLKIATKLIGKERALKLVFDNPRAVVYGEAHEGAFVPSESIAHSSYAF
ncbi:MAG: hypothetical protein MJE63_00905 [Proteobacteria bacterium]|nr:hypothetical protein [Pseudomonadota bacterium]